VLLETGVRLGEALGLQWSDVDFTREQLHVRRALVRPTHGVDWVLETPKSGRTREVPMLPTTVEALQRHRDQQQVERLVAGEKYRQHPGAPSGFVFADERGEPLQGTVVYKYHWRPTLARLSLPAIRLHDCRHTAATLMHEAGYEMKDIQATLGHATIAITADIYAHLLPEHQRRQTRKLAAYLARTRTNKGQPGAAE
jgi:integrase